MRRHQIFMKAARRAFLQTGTAKYAEKAMKTADKPAFIQNSMARRKCKKTAAPACCAVFTFVILFHVEHYVCEWLFLQLFTFVMGVYVCDITFVNMLGTVS